MGPIKILLTLSVASLAIFVWTRTIRNWRFGLEAFLLYMPISGAIQCWLYPAAWAVLIKDFAFVIPTYIGFVFSGEASEALAALPGPLRGVLTGFVTIVVIQALNPWGAKLLATLIGLKVWLFYLPMLLLGYSYVTSEGALLRLSRIMIGLLWLPCSIGLFQFLLSVKYGSAYAVGLFYSPEAAEASTHVYRTLDNGLVAVPATFAFITQYLNYVLCMFVPVLGTIEIQHDTRWKKLAAVSLWLLCLAGFTTGARSAFLMVPGMLILFYLLKRGLTGAVYAVALAATTFLLAAWAFEIDVPALLNMEVDLTNQYAYESTVNEFGGALRLTQLGQGVGSHTGAARNAADDPDVFSVGFENYYAKTVAELGLPGLFIVLILQIEMIFYSYHCAKSLIDSPLQRFCLATTALTVIVLIYNVKGTVIDEDPLNALYWLFGGATLATSVIGWEQEFVADAVVNPRGLTEAAVPNN